jgi:hypothetical protein
MSGDKFLQLFKITEAINSRQIDQSIVKNS